MVIIDINILNRKLGNALYYAHVSLFEIESIIEFFNKSHFHKIPDQIFYDKFIKISRFVKLFETSCKILHKVYSICEHIVKTDKELSLYDIKILNNIEESSIEALKYSSIIKYAAILGQICNRIRVNTIVHNVNLKNQLNNYNGMYDIEEIKDLITSLIKVNKTIDHDIHELKNDNIIKYVLSYYSKIKK